MLRAFVLPVFLMSLVGGPMLYSHHQHHSGSQTTDPQGQPTQPWQLASHVTLPNTPFETSSRELTAPVQYSTGFPQRQIASVGQTRSFMPTSSVSSPTSVAPARSGVGSDRQPSPANVVASPVSISNDMAWAQPGMVPDFAKTETFVFSGDANGPDVSAGPMSFTPTIDIGSLFRFDISKQWITSRWDRVSTCPSNDGLHGMRVALVTGTNSWDLHGSLTYYFDANHRVQRITYRGWTGDANRLLGVLQPHQLKPQPTHWAGVYLSKRSGLLMKYPAVIDKSNSVQQLALILELNNPKGNAAMSGDFRNLLPAAIASR